MNIRTAMRRSDSRCAFPEPTTHELANASSTFASGGVPFSGFFHHLLQRGHAALVHRAHATEDHLFEQLLLGTKVIVDRCQVGSGLPRQFAERYTVVTMRGEHAASA